jgi:hypothetical protein
MTVYQLETNWLHGLEIAMTLEGIVQKGMIVLKNGASLPDGTRVKVSIAPTKKNIGDVGKFFHSATIDELAAAQGVSAPCSFDDLLGGWPDSEKDDRFEDTVADWRKEDVRRGEF